MSILNEIINNKCIVVPFCLWIIIQVYKFVYELVVNKAIVPTEEELKNNPRARSAKLRVIEKIK